MKHLEYAFLQLKTEKEVSNFMRDLMTPKEIKDFNDRWQIVQLLNKGKLSYRKIAEELKVSVTTVTRVARFLKDEPYRGYRLILDRLKNEN